jgi:hypothetical protein
MKARILFITAAAALAFIAAAIVMPAAAGGTDDPPNLSGTWKFDAAHSDSPQEMMGGPGRGGPPEGGEQWRHGRNDRDGGGGPGAGDPMRGPARGPMHGIMRIPDRLAILHLSDRIELRDSLGVAVQRILFQPQAGVAPVDSAGVAQLAGMWQGRTLEARVEGPRGGTLQMTYELTDAGKTLKITTRVQPPGDRPAFEFTRLYERVSG